MRKGGRIKPVNERILKGGVGGSGYYIVVLCKDGSRKSFCIHSLMAIVFLNHVPNDNNLVPDHKDGIKLNNKLNNIQIVTHRENSSICFRKNSAKFTSKYIGVSWNKRDNKWISSISINGKCKYIGSFDNEIEASIAYQNRLKQLI